MGSLGQPYAEYDLMQAGFLVFSVEHRLAPNGLLLGQTGHCAEIDHSCAPGTVESGRPPEQWNDIKQEIVAAKADSQCNGEIFLLGASSGGTHAAWCALDPTPLPSPATGWPLLTGTIKAVAGLSGVYDLTLRGLPDVTQTFINDIDNYTNTLENASGHSTQQMASPSNLVASATNIPPFLLFATQYDPVPHEEAENMAGTLNNKVPGIAVEYTLVGLSSHAFNYWHSANPATPGKCVGTNVIEFFQQYK